MCILFVNFNYHWPCKIAASFYLGIGIVLTLISSQLFWMYSLHSTAQTMPGGEHFSSRSWKVRSQSCEKFLIRGLFQSDARRRTTVDQLSTCLWNSPLTVTLHLRWRALLHSETQRMLCDDGHWQWHKRLWLSQSSEHLLVLNWESMLLLSVVLLE